MNFDPPAIIGFLLPGFLLLGCRDFVFPRRKGTDSDRILQWLLYSLGFFYAYSALLQRPEFSDPAQTRMYVLWTFPFAIMLGVGWGSISDRGWYRKALGWIGRSPYSTLWYERMGKVDRYDDPQPRTTPESEESLARRVYVLVPLGDSEAYWGYAERYSLDPEAEPTELFLRPAYLVKLEGAGFAILREIQRGVLLRGDVLQKVEFTQRPPAPGWGGTPPGIASSPPAVPDPPKTGL